MAFTFGNTIRRTVEGQQLAKKLWDFLYYNVPLYKPNTNNVNNQISDWAYDFDELLKNAPFEEVNNVWDYYVGKVVEKLKNKENVKIYTSAKDWVRNYIYIRDDYYRHYRPIPIEKLERYLYELRYVTWHCDKEDVYTSLSKSVYVVSKVIVAIRNFKPINDTDLYVKKYLLDCIGNIVYFVTDEYKKWSYTSYIRNATITVGKMCGFISKFLDEGGFPVSYKQRWTRTIVNKVGKQVASI